MSVGTVGLKNPLAFSGPILPRPRLGIQAALPFEGCGHQEPTRQIAKRDQQHHAQSPDAPQVGQGKLKHVRDALLKATGDKNRDAEKQADVAPKLIALVLIVLDAHTHQKVAKNTK